MSSRDGVYPIDMLQQGRIHFSPFLPRYGRYLSNKSLDIRNILQEKIYSAIVTTFGQNIAKSTKVHVTAISQEEFGHYQCTSAMPLAKILKMKPHDVAMKIFQNLDRHDIIQSTEVAGPGFMNLR